MSASNESFQAPPPPTVLPSQPAPRPTKLRPFAIGFFVLGIIVLGAGIPKVIPGGIQTGGVMALFGVILFAFSFIPLPVIPNAEAPLSFFDRITGIFFEPSKVFRNLRAHPHWVGAFVILAVLTTVYAFAFVQRVTPERIVDHTTQKLAEMGPPFAPPPERLEIMKQAQLAQMTNPFERVGTVIKSSIGIFVIASLAAALSLLCILAFGGRINFWQALAVTFYAWLPVIAIQKLLGLLIMYLKDPDALHPIRNQETTLQDNLSLLVSAADHPVLFVLATFFGLTWIYYLWLRAKGLHYGGTKVSSAAGWGVSLTLYFLLMIFLVSATALFPTFVT